MTLTADDIAREVETDEHERADYRAAATNADHFGARLMRDFDRVQAAYIAQASVERTPWTDKPTPDDAAIKAAHPTVTGRHDLFMRALDLVGARHGKYALVNCMNWLLARAEAAEASLSTARQEGRDEAVKEVVAFIDDATFGRDEETAAAFHWLAAQIDRNAHLPKGTEAANG